MYRLNCTAQCISTKVHILNVDKDLDIPTVPESCLVPIFSQSYSPEATTNLISNNCRSRLPALDLISGVTQYLLYMFGLFHSTCFWDSSWCCPGFFLARNTMAPWVSSGKRTWNLIFLWMSSCPDWSGCTRGPLGIEGTHRCRAHGEIWRQMHPERLTEATLGIVHPSSKLCARCWGPGWIGRHYPSWLDSFYSVQSLGFTWGLVTTERF